jgi:hypothetical protein
LWSSPWTWGGLPAPGKGEIAVIQSGQYIYFDAEIKMKKSREKKLKKGSQHFCWLKKLERSMLISDKYLSFKSKILPKRGLSFSTVTCRIFFFPNSAFCSR